MKYTKVFITEKAAVNYANLNYNGSNEVTVYHNHMLGLWFVTICPRSSVE